MKSVISFIPNLVTLTRVAMGVPIIVLTLRGSDVYVICAALYATAAATDFLDGFLARRLHQQSTLGAFLDPLADKIVTEGSMIALAFVGDFLVVPLVLLVTRDVLITGLRIVLHDPISPSRLAKWKTATLFVGVCTAFVAHGPNASFLVVSDVFVFVATVLAIVTALRYLFTVAHGSSPRMVLR